MGEPGVPGDPCRSRWVRLLRLGAVTRVNESETYRGPLLALVDEVRRLREVALGDEYQNKA